MLRAQSSRRSPIILAQTGVAASVTGTLVETTLASIIVPGGMMGPNGSLRIKTKSSYTNSANNKTFKISFGGTSVISVVRTTANTDYWLFTIDNRGNAASQLAANSSIPVGASGSVFGLLAIDTTVDALLTITGTLANTGETITLEGYTVEVLPA